MAKEWADKYKGKFDGGWDKYRKETFERQKKLGVIPQDAVLTERPNLFPAWDSLNDAEKKLYTRQMEVYAGFQENADWNAGRLLDAIEEMGDLDNTLIFYIWGDNGASMEGTITGSFNEMTFLNGVALDAEQQLKLIEQVWGGIEGWGAITLRPIAPRPGRTRATRRSSGASKWRATWEARATRWSLRGRSEFRLRVTCPRSSPTASTSAQQSSRLLASLSQSSSMASSRSRWTAPLPLHV